jgi:hypothetical protein
LPYALVPRVLSSREWMERYATPGAEAEFYARFSGGPVAFTRRSARCSRSARKSPEKPWIGVMTARPHHKIEDLSDEQINHTRLGVSVGRAIQTC